jgi:hypothetical protein
MGCDATAKRFGRPSHLSWRSTLVYVYFCGSLNSFAKKISYHEGKIF